MFNSLFTNGIITETAVLISLLLALVAGILFAFMCFFRTKSTKSFLVATAMLPMVVALVIILVNGNIGTGVAIAGAFSLVRFRSAPGTAKEISIIFISMAAGLAFGMGYVGYGFVFIVLAGIALILFETFGIWIKKPDSTDKTVRITMPEELDYTTVFKDIFDKYTKKYELVQMKTTNMGSLFRVDYHVILKDSSKEKDMVDEIRCRNGNLEVAVHRTHYVESEL